MDDMSDLERLLAEEGIDLGSVAEERPEGSEGMSARDWMIATSDDELIRKKVGDEPMAETSRTESTSQAADPGNDEDNAFAGMSDLERLLAEEGIELGAVAEERPKGAEGMSARDYLISTSDDELIRNKIGQETIGETAVAAPQPLDSDESDDDLPDWLTAEPDSALDDVAFGGEIETASAVADDKMVVEGDLPDWLRDVEEETAAAELPASFDEEDDLMVIENDLPDWLQEDDEELLSVVEPITEAELLDITSAADDLPDWLQDIEDEEPAAMEASVTPQPEATISEDDKMVVEDDLPSWLREEEDAAVPEAAAPIAATAEENDKMVVEDDLPDWLRDEDEDDTDDLPVASEVGALPPADQSDESFEGLPDWLDEVEEDNVVLDADTPDEDLPDWLRDVQEDEPVPEPLPQPAADDDDLPDWLKEVQEEDDRELAAPLPVASAVDDLDESEDEQFDDEDLPDWLREVQEEEDVTVPPAAASASISDEIDTSTIDEDLPDWLQEDQDDVVDEEPFDSEFREVVTDELPDWLADAQTGDEEPFEPSEPSPLEAEELVIEEDLPDWLQQEDEELEVVEEDVVPEPVAEADGIVEEDELPDWLKEDAIDEDEIALESIETAEAVVAEEAIPEVPEAVVAETRPGDMPDWLKKLRHGDDDAQPVSIFDAKPAPVLATVHEPQPAAQLTSEADGDEAKLPADPDERLKMAQAARDMDDLPSAIRLYDSLVLSSAHLDKVIDDVEMALKTHPSNYQLYQVLGDAMMKDGRLQSALDAYRKALEKL